MPGLSPELDALASAQWRPRHSPWLVAAAVMLATFMEVLDTTIVNVSLTHIAGNLAVTAEEATWALTSYLVCNAVVLPATGWFSSFFGRKRFLLVCVGIFTAASILCGSSTSLAMLIVARCLQGLGGGALQPISQAVLLESFPPQKRGLAMAAFGLGVVVAPIIGPTLGGWITDNYSWRWIFYVNIPVGIAAFFMIEAFVHDPPYIRAQRSRIDYVGFALLVLWIGALQVMLDKGQQEDWLSSSFIKTLMALFVTGLVVFVIWELSVAQPLVNLRILKNRNFAMGTAVMGVMGAVLYGSTALLPLFLQTLMGYPAVQSGMALSPRGVGSIAGMVIVGRLIGVIDTRWMIAIGFTLLGMATFQLGNLSLDVSMGAVVYPNIVNGFATAMIFVPLTMLTMGTLRNEQMGNATGIFNLMRNLGGGVGIAMVTTFLARGAQVHQAAMVGHMSAYDRAYQTHLAGVSASLTPQLGRMAAEHAAVAVVYGGELLRQATLWAFVENFRLLALLSLGCIGTALVFRRGMRSTGAGMGH